MVVVVVVVLVEDLIMEILLRLPPVSILKLKSVCKSWYSLISNPCFHINHVRQFHHLSQRDRCVVDPPPPPPGLLLSSQCLSSEHYSVYAIFPQDQKPDHPLLKLYLDSKPDPPLLKLHLEHSVTALEPHKFSGGGSRCSLINSCNGLLLYQTKSTKSGIPDQYNVFNPITNQYKEVPIMDILGTFIKPNHQTTLYLSPQIVFDPSLLLSYKVLLILLQPSHTHSQLYVYSDNMGSCSWRLVTSFASKFIIGRKSCMYNGVFYWLKDHVSICFDFVEENVWFQPLPRIPARYARREVIYFGECGGRLRLIEEYSGLLGYKGGVRLPCSFHIMEMEQGSSIWTVKSRVNIEAGYDNPLYLAVVKIIHLYETEEGEEVILLNLLDYQKLVSFNITTNTFGKELTIPDYFKSRAKSINAFPFIPTFFPLLTS